MNIDKTLFAGSSSMLILKLLEREDLYGYKMIESLAMLSCDTFSLKAGTLYPLLHNLEAKGLIESYEKTAENSKMRKYYSITPKGIKTLRDKEKEWTVYCDAVNNVLLKGVFVNG